MLPVPKESGCTEFAVYSVGIVARLCNQDFNVDPAAPAAFRVVVNATLATMPVSRLSFDESSAIAMRALAFLASDEARLARFLALSGVTPATLATDVGNPSLHAGVLEHLLADEPMLLEFCANQALAPDLPGRALAVLSAGSG